MSEFLSFASSASHSPRHFGWHHLWQVWLASQGQVWCFRLAADLLDWKPSSELPREGRIWLRMGHCMAEEKHHSILADSNPGAWNHNAESRTDCFKLSGILATEQQLIEQAIFLTLNLQQIQHDSAMHFGLASKLWFTSKRPSRFDHSRIQ